MKVFYATFIFVGFVLSGCVSSGQTIEFRDGSSYDYKTKRITFDDGNQITLTDRAEVFDDKSGVIATIVHHDSSSSCVGGRDQLVLEGTINEDSYRLIKAAFAKMKNCGLNYGFFVSLKSNGGSLYQGFKIGSLFRENYARVFIHKDTVCASSCAFAFLAATQRYMDEGASIAFHAPYLRSAFYDDKRGINCALEQAKNDLKKYLNQVLPNETADYVYRRSVSVCSANEGWVLNDDAAHFLELTNIDNKTGKYIEGRINMGALKLGW